MEVNPGLKKLKYKSGYKVLVTNAPSGSLSIFNNVNIITEPSVNDIELMLLFVYNKADVDKFANLYLKYLKYDGLLWFAYPKGSSRIKTDISRDTGWDTVRKFNLITVAVVSLDDTWSALRFRPFEKVKSSNK